MTENCDPPCCKLLRQVVRFFYPDHFSVIVDAIAIHRSMRVEDLVEFTHLTETAISLALAHLEKDQILQRGHPQKTTHSSVKRYRAQKSTRGQLRPDTVSFYYVDYPAFINIVQLKLLRIQKHAEETVPETGCLQYECTRNSCKRTYSFAVKDSFAHLDLFDARQSKFVCKACKGELLASRLAAYATANLGNVANVNSALAPLYETLRASQGMAFDEAQIPQAPCPQIYWETQRKLLAEMHTWTERTVSPTTPRYAHYEHAPRVKVIFDTGAHWKQESTVPAWFSSSSLDPRKHETGQQADSLPSPVQFPSSAYDFLDEAPVQDRPCSPPLVEQPSTEIEPLLNTVLSVGSNLFRFRDLTTKVLAEMTDDEVAMYESIAIQLLDMQ